MDTVLLISNETKESGILSFAGIVHLLFHDSFKTYT